MQQITTPTLLVDKSIASANIERMAKKARQSEALLKPHFKTHQSKEIADWFRAYGVNAITVSSVKMAEYFAQHGWDDITIAFPCNWLLADRINVLASEIDLSILVSDHHVLPQLIQRIHSPLKVYIEIDTWARRSGLPANDIELIAEILQALQETSHLRFKGFYSHPGHSYSARSSEEIAAIHRQVLKQMIPLKKYFKSYSPALCIGDTPCCSIASNFNEVDEVSAGNFVFYDLMQVQIGSCQVNDIAVALACPVVAKYPERREIVIHGGAIHLSKESLTEGDMHHFGKVVSLDTTLSWSAPVDGCYAKALSQEHGIIQCSKEFFDQVEMGDIIGILPVHSCLTADAMKSYYLIQERQFLEHMQGSL